MLLGDGGLAAPPGLAELVQVREHDFRQHGFHAQRPQQAVGHGVRGGIVEPREGFRELVLRRLDTPPLRSGTAERSVRRAASAAATPAPRCCCIASTRSTSASE
jgi:hypothetical protein